MVWLARPNGRIAQLVRAPVLHTGGRGFESLFAHTARFVVVKAALWLLRQIG